MVQELAVNDLEQPAFDMCAMLCPPCSCTMRCSHRMLRCRHSLLLQRLYTCKLTAYCIVGQLILACADGIMCIYAACRSWDS